MAIMRQRVTIIKYRRPSKKNLNEELQYFGDSFGLFGQRDKERSCFRVFIELLKATRGNRALSSDEIALKTKLSRGTIIHHLHKLIEAGLIIQEQGRYILRAGNLEAVVEEIQKDVNRTIEDLRNIAKEIDSGMGL